ncbi:GMC family oxidoreductase N-terminal domain-containing protein [Catellatospora bangladeshensis]|uniref:GMC family oxidoreductase N-terminal domain-containing protein n=1 Tax=Catellatospora bangladeshensis TaxID=310355 RepID=UPI003618E761
MGHRRSVHRQPLHLPRHLVRPRRQGIPAAGPLLRRRRHQTLRRRPLPAAPRRLRRHPAPRRPVPRLAHHLRGDGALVHHGRTALRSPRQPRRRPHRTARLRALPLPGATPRTPHPATVRRPHRRRLPPVPRPCGVRLNEADINNSICIRCARCDGFPCPLHAKSDAETLAVRPALTAPNVTMLTHAHVVRLETNPEGTAVTQVIVDHEGHEERYSAAIVAVAAGAANTAKLLLMSATDRHPRGLANGSDQVGRNYMYHLSQAVLALSREPNDTVFQKTLGLNDFYFRGPGFDYPMGNIQMIGKSAPDMYRGEKPSRRNSPRHGPWPTSPGTPSTSGCPPKTCPYPATASPSPATATSSSTTHPATPPPPNSSTTSSNPCSRRCGYTKTTSSTASPT